MKGFFKNNSERIWANVIVGIVLIAFYFLISKIGEFVGALGFISSVLSPFVIGFVIAYVLWPFVEKFEAFCTFLSRKIKIFKTNKKEQSENKERNKLKRAFSILIVYVLVLILLVILINQLIPQIVDSAVTLVNNIPSYVVRLDVFLTDFINNFNLDKISFDHNKLYSELMDYATAFTQTFLNWILNVPKHLSSGITNTIIGIILSIYFIYDKENFSYGASRATRAIFGKNSETVLDISRLTGNCFSEFFMGKLIDSTIIGFLAFPFMLMIYKPYALLISAIIGITNIIPYFGPIFGAIPGAFIILINAPRMLIWYLIFVLVLQQFDGNILGPKILGNRTGLSPVGVIFGIVVGSKLFGFIGMIIGVPITAVIYTVIRDYVNKRNKDEKAVEEVVNADENGENINEA